MEPVRCQSVGYRSLNELQISEGSEVDGQVSQGLVGLVDDEYVYLHSRRAGMSGRGREITTSRRTKDDVELLHGHTCFRVHRIRESCEALRINIRRLYYPHLSRLTRQLHHAAELGDEVVANLGAASRTRQIGFHLSTSSVSNSCNGKPDEGLELRTHVVTIGLRLFGELPERNEVVRLDNGLLRILCLLLTRLLLLRGDEVISKSQRKSCAIPLTSSFATILVYAARVSFRKISEAASAVCRFARVSMQFMIRSRESSSIGMAAK
jgi:hypothetical protein